MKISTKGRYAVRMMLDLALHNTGEYISLKDISRRQEITVKYLEQIVTALTKNGFLRSQRGNNGGYRLARAPNQCGRSAECVMLPFWEGLAKVINDYTDAVTLEDLAERSYEMAGNDYSI